MIHDPVVQSTMATATDVRLLATTSTHTMKSTKCCVCNQDFPSRNQLFVHLKASGHGGSLEERQGDGGATGQGGGNDDGAAAVGSRLSGGNDAYYEYYLRQKICDGERAWDDAYERLRSPLPVTYRVQESSWIGEFSAQLLTRMGNDKDGSSSKKKGETMGEADADYADVSGGNQRRSGIFDEWSIGFGGSFGGDASDTPKLRVAVTTQYHRSNKSKKQDKGAGVGSTDENEQSSVLHALQELGGIHRQELVR